MWKYTVEFRVAAYCGALKTNTEYGDRDGEKQLTKMMHGPVNTYCTRTEVSD